MQKKIALPLLLFLLSITSVSASEKSEKSEYLMCELWKYGAEHAMTSRQVRGISEENAYSNIVTLFEKTPLVRLNRAPKYLVKIAYQEPVRKRLAEKQYVVNEFASEQFEYCLSASEEAKGR